MVKQTQNSIAANDEDVESKSTQSTISVHNLFKSSVDTQLSINGIQWWDISPEKFDEFKKSPDKLKDLVIVEMKDSRKEDMTNWWEISDSDIERYMSVYAIDMKDELMRRGSRLIIERKKFIDKAILLFPDIKGIPDYESRLKEVMKTMNEDELKKYSSRSSRMRGFLKWEKEDASDATFPELQDDAVQVKLSEVFQSDLDIFFSEEKNRTKLLRIFRNYESFWQLPWDEDIKFILYSYTRQNAPIQRIQEILTRFRVTLPIKLAHDLGFIDDQYIENLICSDSEEVKNIYQMLTQDEKRRTLWRIKLNSDIRISIEEMNMSHLKDILKDKFKWKILINAITQGIDLGEVDKMKLRSGVLQRVSERKTTEAESKGKWVESYDIFEAFKEQLIQYESSFRDTTWQPNIKNFKNLSHGWYISFSADGLTHYMRISRIYDGNGQPLNTFDGDNGVEIEYFPVVGGIVRDKGKKTISYDQILKEFSTLKNARVYTESEFQENVLTDSIEWAWEKSGKVYINPQLLQDDYSTTDPEVINSEALISQELNMIDPPWEKYGFWVGTCFLASSTEEWTGKVTHDDFWQVTKIGDGVISLMDSDGHQVVKDFPINALYKILINTTWFKRVNRIQNDADFVKQMKEIGDLSLDASTNLQDGQFKYKKQDDHWHETEQSVTTFSAEKWWHIRLWEIRDGVVHFWEYQDGEDIMKVREYAKKHGIDKKLKWYYSWRSMSYAAFIEYTKRQKFKVSSKDPILPEEAAHGFHDHKHEHSHLHGNFLQRVMKLQNPASIMKGFEMIYHAIEHTLEKGAKLDAARFALGTSRFLSLPSSVNAQIYADVVEWSKEIVEKIEKKIFWLPGPEQRWKCIHIAHNTDSRPEEVAAGISVMMKSYGHLYAEDIKHFQSTVSEYNIEHKPAGHYAFFDALIITSKVPGDLIGWRKKAYKKAVQEMGTESDHEGEPTEEQMIHSLFKTIDGNWNDYPYAASVIKALGGPSGYEKMWKFEGYETAYKKGKDQTQMVNAQWRLHKAVGYLGTHEIYKAVGAMEAVAGKIKSPEFQAMPFIWAVGWFSRYASHAALQKLKAYSEGGFTFHAFSFLRSADDNKTYKKMVEMALKQIGGDTLLTEFQWIAQRLEYNQDNPQATEKAAMNMMQFWQRNCHRWLHDMLQGHNGWLLKLRKDGNTDAINYWKKFVWQHAMQLKDSTIPGTEFGKDWFDEHGYENIIMWETEDGKLRSLFPMLNKIRFEWWSYGGGARDMNDIHKEKIWNYIKRYMNGPLRDKNMFSGDEDLMREQYLAHRKEIILYFARQLATRTQWNVQKDQADQNMRVNLRTYPYYRDLAGMGITPEAVFSESVQDGTEADDYTRWRKWQTAPLIGGIVSADDLMKSVSGEIPKLTTPPELAPNSVRRVVDPDMMIPPANSELIPEAD